VVNTPLDELRQRLARELTELRATLPRDLVEDLVPLHALTRPVFERLVKLGQGSLACVLLTLLTERRDGNLVSAETAPQAALMVMVALRRLGSSLRRSDLVVRAGEDRLAWLLPGAGGLEARGLASRLASSIDGAEVFVADQRTTLRCRVGLALSTPKRPLDLVGLLEAAERDRFS